jgi:uncharacterized protein with FMN-binding domain
MRRAAVITGITVVWAAWLLTFKTTAHSSGLAAAPTSPPDQTSVQPSSPASPGTSPSAAPTPQGVSGTFTGQDVPNRFGDVQVQVVVANGRITSVKALHLPSDRAQSAYISQVAGPLLHDEALQAQSARIDIISGATYTSDSYAQSLESALQQAHMG